MAFEDNIYGSDKAVLDALRDPSRYKASHSYSGFAQPQETADFQPPDLEALKSIPDKISAMRSRVPSNRQGGYGGGADRYGNPGYGYPQGYPPNSYPGSYQNSPGYQGYQMPPTRKPKRKRGKLKFIVLLVIVVLGFLGFSACSAIDAKLHDFDPAVQQELDHKLSPSSMLGLGPSTVLLLGSDERVGDPELGARTDAIVLARVDPLAKKISMLSIPRDTMVEIEGYGTQKINAAYTFGGPSGAVKAVEDLCGVKVDHCIVVDFDGLAGIIDAIGGIDVMVDEMIDDPDAGDQIIEAGQQHLDGAQSLIFSRSRAYADGDYTRQSNQRKVISAMAHGILARPFWEYPSVFSSVADCVSTDSATTALGLGLSAIELKLPGSEMEMDSAVLPSHPEDIDGISYVVADEKVPNMVERFKRGAKLNLEEEPVEEPAGE